ncbi:hypothetical protein HPP92_024561 [Vanilla planifolia]|uniref:Uncharacterized protein n=1 Tax=Vanilla planifolia TaxID=51239 RepID=A0A835PL24_VANPL|nr:hypothetical protein HPP92_024561 [Vanilla planifolia]
MEERDWWHRERQEAAEQYLPHNVCGKGHRRSLALETAEGGCICLPCFAALLSDPRSPSHHVSYALFQLSRAISDPYVLRELRGKHAYFIVSPLVSALSVFDDEALARQVIDLVSDLCFRRDNGGLGEVDERSASSLLSGDFIARIADWLAGTQAWSRRQIRMLHCFGVLLSSFNGTSPAAHIREQAALFSNLFVGLQLPSEELRGEVLFVIYKLCSSNVTPWDDLDSDIDNGIDSLDAGATTLVRLTLEILLRTQYDEVRMNCLALLLILVGKGFQSSFLNSYHNLVLEEASKQKEEITQQTPLINLFADAIKGPLLSSDEEIQIRTLDLIFYMLSPGNCSLKQILVLVKEDIPDYIFEVLRLSANKEPIVMSCIRALTLFTTVEEAFNQKLVLGLPTLLSILHYTSQLPLHPAQPQALNLVCNCVSSFPGIMSTSQVEDLALILTSILKRCINGEYPETFLLACSTFVEILKSPSSSGIQKIGELVQEASRGSTNIL